jgi:L-fucose mutarotase/ribose pyranase (RbsD/FucU family)
LKKTIPILSLLLLLACSAFGQGDWRTMLKRELPVMGHRNWIVVADSAYPAQVSPGVVTIYTDGTQLDTVREVLKMLSGTKHVTPNVFLDQEITSLSDDLVPGISSYKSNLARLLGKRPVAHMLHGDLIAKLDEAGKTFKVIILKTNLTLPYTSVFFQLDCAYWGPAMEKKLRAKMGKG